MEQINTCKVLADWTAAFDLNHTDKDYKHSVRFRILDYVISAVAGLKVNNDYNHMAERVMYGFGGNEQSSVLFCHKKVPAPAAAYMNATYGHGADLDDGHKTANGHPGVAVIPAVLALAESESRPDKSIYEGILTGYEIYIRVSNAIQPSALQRGFHGTGVVGAVAASAACAKLLGLDADKIHQAISYGAVQASGLFEVSESGQMTKPVNPANACRTGIISALMAREGIRAPVHPFEGVKGFYKAFSGNSQVEEITSGLDDQLLIDTSYVKLYPACRHLHPVVDAGAVLRKMDDADLNQIKSIRITTYPNSILVTGNIRKPVSADEAKFSMTYALAKALQNGTYTLDDLEDCENMGPETSGLIDKMEIIPDSFYENKQDHIRGCHVALIMENGQVLETSRLLPKGDPETPLTEADMMGKMSACCNGIYDRTVQSDIQKCIMQDETLDLSHLFQILHQYTNM